MLRCSKCNEKKTADNFYLNKAYPKRLHDYYCKICRNIANMPYTSEYRKSYYRNHPEYRKKVAETHRRFKERHPNYYKDYNRNWKAENREKRKISEQRYEQRHPEKRRAWERATRIPKDSECKNCGSTENLEHHHLDYENDVVVTLCSPCHIETHRARICV